MQIKKKLALNSGLQTNQILTNDDEVCIPRLSSILLAVLCLVSSFCTCINQSCLLICTLEQN